ncbi:MAG: VWA domain-containing protein [Nitrospira sp.]|nr:VWA domain-containing protein [Nitrospira sp.]
MNLEATLIEWRAPWLLLVAVYPWALAVWHWLASYTANQAYADADLLPWCQLDFTGRISLRQWWRQGMLGLAWGLFAIALAGPRVAQTAYHSDPAKIPELVLVVDLSRSMTARDVVPNRLSQMQLKLRDLIDRVRNTRMAVLVYAGASHVLLPPTEDKYLLKHYIGLLRHGLLPTEGTNIPAALNKAREVFTPGQTKRSLMLISDGDVPALSAAQRSDLESTVTDLAQQGIVVYTWGVGTATGASLLTAQGDWLRHDDREVVSRLHEDLLRALAARGNGRYAPMSASDADLRVLYDQGFSRAEVGDDVTDAVGLILWRELYAWFLLPALLVFIFAHWQGGRATAGNGVAALSLLLAFGAAGYNTSAGAAERDEQQAYAAYAKAMYQQAGQRYARIAGFNGRMGEGASAYQLGSYRQAIRQFTLAALDADTDTHRADALFNLANSYYRLADYAKAATLYQDVLRYRQDAAASKNLALAGSLLARQRDRTAQTGSSRPGRGPRTAALPAGTDVNQSSVSLADSVDEKPEAPPGSSLAAPGDLIQKGIHDAQPAVSQAQEFTDVAWVYEHTGDESIVLKAETLSTDDSMIWQRLFEVEEDIGAPLSVPRELEGVPPW